MDHVEHLLDVFTATDPNANGVSDAYASFTDHLGWHKPRLVVLGPKITGLSDDYLSKLDCFLRLSRPFRLVRNYAECRLHLFHVLGPWRQRRGGERVVMVLLKH